MTSIYNVLEVPIKVNAPVSIFHHLAFRLNHPCIHIDIASVTFSVRVIGLIPVGVDAASGGYPTGSITSSSSRLSGTSRQSSTRALMVDASSRKIILRIYPAGISPEFHAVRISWYSPGGESPHASHIPPNLLLSPSVFPFRRTEDIVFVLPGETPS